jgi:DNA ligase 1
MKTKLFQPIESMNPIYLGAADDALYDSILMEHNGKTFAEIKEDGYRMQLHKKGNDVKAFTRSKNQIYLELFPELEYSIKNLPDCILDAEIRGGIGHMGFYSVKKRFRSKISEKGLDEYLNSGIVNAAPITLRVFDTLYWKGKELIDKSLYERRKYTENILEEKISPSELNIINDPLKLKNIFEQLVGENYEGLVCKNPDSIYQPGAKNKDWIKLKRSETLDLTVLGVYMDKEEISQLLCGTINNGRYETLGKVNAKREGMNKELSALLENKFLPSCPQNVLINQAAYSKPDAIPDYFINPDKSIVVEVAAMNFNRGKNWHSCGLEDGNAYSLRIGWLKNIRDDKSPKDSTTSDQVKMFYENERSE